MGATDVTGRHVLLIGGKDSGFASIADLGVRVTLIQQRADLSLLQIQRATRLICRDSIDAQEATAVATALHAVDPFEVVVSFSEASLLLAAQLGEGLGVVHNPRHAVELTRDKLAMRALLAEHGLPTVRFASCSGPADVDRFLAEVGGPVIVKPCGGSGSRGVARVDDSSGVADAWAWCTGGGAPPAIIEELVHGREYSVESLTLAGRHEVLMITEKLTTGAPGFVEIGHQMPARLAPPVQAEITATVTGLLDAVGHRWGPAHTEIMVSADGTPTIIETQTRFGGDQIWEMTQHLTGVPMAAATVAGMLGSEAVPSPRPVTTGAAIRFFVNENAVVTNVTAAEDARRAPGVARLDIRARPGTTLGPLQDSWSRQGYVLAYGRDTEEAVTRAESAAQLVRFQLEPAVAPS